MAIEQPGYKIGQFLANADLSGKQYYAVNLNSSAKWAVAGAGQRTIGVLQNAPKSGEAAEVVMYGLTKAQAGGTITAGDPIAVDSAGKFVKALDNDYQVGQAFESAASGEVFTLFLSGGQGLTEATSPA